MFHVYFGAFDFVLYGAAFVFALCLSEAICDEIDAGYQSKSTIRPTIELTALAQPALEKKAAATQSVNKHHETAYQSGSSFEDKATPSQSERSTVEKNNATNRPVLNLANIRLYRLRKQSVIKLCDLPSQFNLPEAIKRYKLRGEFVIQLQALKTYAEVIT